LKLGFVGRCLQSLDDLLVILELLLLKLPLDLLGIEELERVGDKLKVLIRLRQEKRREI
jgi:hypothetical protein